MRDRGIHGKAHVLTSASTHTWLETFYALSKARVISSMTSMQVYVEGMTSDGHATAPQEPAGADAAARGSIGWQKLLHCAHGCSLVVTEDMPVPPDEGWARTLREQLPESIEVWAVDTACMVPLQSVPKRYEVMRAYRQVTQAKRYDRMRAMYGTGDQVRDHTGEAVKACVHGAVQPAAAVKTEGAPAQPASEQPAASAVKAEPAAAQALAAQVAPNTAASSSKVAKRKASPGPAQPDKRRRGPARRCKDAAAARVVEAEESSAEEELVPAQAPADAVAVPAATAAAPVEAAAAPPPALNAVHPLPVPLEGALALSTLDLRAFIKRVPWVDQRVARAPSPQLHAIRLR